MSTARQVSSVIIILACVWSSFGSLLSIEGESNDWATPGKSGMNADSLREIDSTLVPIKLCIVI
jgi:hypothetical protein